MSIDNKISPTQETYSDFQNAYNYFNKNLFNEALPPCLITLQRKGRSFGYYSPQRFKHRTTSKTTDEIAINPDHISKREPIDILATLVHEMVHLKQEHFGSPSRGGYHNREWAAMMESVGLIPSSTGEPDGERTGQAMSHYILPGGEFERHCQQLLTDGICLSWGDRFGQNEQKSKSSRAKYTCSTCQLNAWAKHGISLLCGKCREPLRFNEDSLNSRETEALLDI